MTPLKDKINDSVVSSVMESVKDLQRPVWNSVPSAIPVLVSVCRIGSVCRSVPTGSANTTSRIERKLMQYDFNHITL